MFSRKWQLKTVVPGLSSLLCLLLLTHGIDATAAEIPSAPATPPAQVQVDLKPTPALTRQAAPAKKLKPKPRPQQIVAAPSEPEAIPAQVPFAAELDMFVGETRVLREANVGRLAVGSGKVLSAAVLDNKEILLIANEIGISSLHIWTGKAHGKRIKINVLPAETFRVTREVASFLQTIPNTRVSNIGDKVIVEGDTLSDVNIAKIDEIAKRYPQVINFTNRLGWEKMILMEVKVVEFPTNELREIGLKWSPTGGVAVGGVWMPVRRGNDGPYQIDLLSGDANPAPIVPNEALGQSSVPLSSSLNILSVVNMGLNAQLNLMAQNGKATILAEPVLSARNGSKASFLAGGEFPYELSTDNGPAVFFREYGVKLNIEPRVDHNGVIRAKIFSEVSNIDSSIATRAGPALSSRKTETEFNVNNGETIVLSGLLSRETSSQIDKVPFLGDVPILGALFRSKRFQNKETELVIFVTPRVVDSQGSDAGGHMARAKAKLAAPQIEPAPAAPGANPSPEMFWWQE